MAKRAPEARAAVSARMRTLWDDPVWAAKRKRQIAAMNRRPEIRSKRAEHLKAKWADPDSARRMRERTRVALQSEATKKKLSDALRKRWADPKYRTQMVRAAKASAARCWRNPEIRALKLAGIRKGANRPDVRAARSMRVRNATYGPCVALVLTAELRAALVDCLRRKFSRLRTAEELGVSERVLRRWVREIQKG